MSVYVVYNEGCTAVAYVAKSKKSAEEYTKNMYMPVVRKYDHLTQAQASALSYAQATFFEAVMKESK